MSYWCNQIYSTRVCNWVKVRQECRGFFVKMKDLLNKRGIVWWLGVLLGPAMHEDIRGLTCGHAPAFILAQVPPDFTAGVCSVPYLNPCAPEAECKLTVAVVGEAYCVCPSGYAGDGVQSSRGGSGCVNINECQAGLHSCDPVSQRCIDNDGSYECECIGGFHLAPNTKTCLDIDECSHPALNTCMEGVTVCRNLPGSFECDCADPLQIRDPIAGNCRDIDECKDLEGVMNPCEQECENRPSGVQCRCRAGYRLKSDGVSCQDVDECAENAHNCNPETSHCNNTDGGFECQCEQALGYVQRNTYTTAQEKEKLKEYDQTARSNQMRQSHFHSRTGTSPSQGYDNSCVNLNECEKNPYICGGPNTCCQDLLPPQKYACLDPIVQAPSENASLLRFGRFLVEENSAIPLEPPGVGTQSAANDLTTPGSVGSNPKGRNMRHPAMRWQHDKRKKSERSRDSIDLHDKRGARKEERGEQGEQRREKREKDGGKEREEIRKRDVFGKREGLDDRDGLREIDGLRERDGMRNREAVRSETFSRGGELRSLSEVLGRYQVEEGLIDSQYRSSSMSTQERLHPEYIEYLNDNIDRYNNILGRFDDVSNGYAQVGFNGNPGGAEHVESHNYLAYAPPPTPATNQHNTYYDNFPHVGYPPENVTGEATVRITAQQNADFRQMGIPAASHSQGLGGIMPGYLGYGVVHPGGPHPAMGYSDMRYGQMNYGGEGGYDANGANSTYSNQGSSGGASSSGRLGGIKNLRVFENGDGFLLNNGDSTYLCPAGFEMGSSLQKSKVRREAKEAVREAFKSVAQDGHISPYTVTNGIVANTNTIAKEAGNWYSALSQVPGGMMEAAVAGATNSPAATSSPTRQGIANPSMMSNIDPNNATSVLSNPDDTLATLANAQNVGGLGAILGTAVAVGLIEKLKFGGGPAQSMYLDRTGKSQKIAYSNKMIA